MFGRTRISELEWSVKCLLDRVKDLESEKWRFKWQLDDLREHIGVEYVHRQPTLLVKKDAKTRT